MSSKKMCGLVKKDIVKKDIKKFTKLVSQPQFACKKCGLVCSDKDRICKPVKLKD
ncbi:hypothetical protein L21SP3_02339 [Sedimentisphaera cyanobacteriorum]|uniref:Uncharacterized protein n=1 Tax=Sedimentisphaera cyanobacteriorum TaxID=1940790 RepID=A0A1Q2HT43_9BACT|nr:hypothetical protein [Sedimentisphaera cyanobacteriorum]AQQ10503.1 hypothetical protein L21SP3_02339 [Sedimentisphaera cyanobacteriorum]